MDIELNTATLVATEQNEVANASSQQSATSPIQDIDEAHRNDTRLQLDINKQEEINKRFGPSTNAVITVPSRPDQIVNDIIQSATNEKRKRMIRTFLVALVPILLSVGFFVWYNSASDKRNGVLLVLGILLLLAGVHIFVISWAFCCCYCCCPSDISDELNENFERAIRLDGITWEDQVDAIREAALPRGFNGWCNANRFDRLKVRQYGHIVFAKAGIIVDELLVLSYERCIVSAIDYVTNNRTQNGLVLQLHIKLRYYTTTKYNTNPITEFDVHLLMPPQMTLEDVETISYKIRTNSRSRLAALRFAW